MSLGRFVVDDFDLDVVVSFGPLFCLLCKGHGVHVVGWAVAEVSGEVNAAHDGGSTVDGCGQGRCVAFVAVDASRQFGVVILVVLHLVVVIGVVSQHHALCEGGHACEVSVVEDHGQFVAVYLLAGSHHGSTGFSVGVNVNLLDLAETDEHGLAAFCTGEGHGGVGLGLEIAVAQNTVDLCLETGGDALYDFG